MTETYYTVLGVPRSATATEIKAAYRELMRQVHPDAVPNASPYWKKLAEEKAKEINEAYQVLSDSAKRRQYDQLLEAYHQAQAQQAQVTYSAGASPSQTPRSGRQTQARSGAWYHRPSYGQRNAYHSSARQRQWKRPAWGVLCLMWAILSSAGIYSARSAGDATFACAMAFGAWRLVARAFSADIQRLLQRFGATAVAQQGRYVTAAICLLLSTLVTLRGAVGERNQRNQAQESRAVWVLDQSGTCFLMEKSELRRRVGLRQISVTDPKCVIRRSEPQTEAVSSSAREGGRPRDKKTRPLAPPEARPAGSEGNPLVVTAAVPLQSTPDPWATVNQTTELKKFCAFDIGTSPCGFGVEETIAILKHGDRVRVLSTKTRTKDGSDVYRIRTAQGWEGWIPESSLMSESSNAGPGIKLLAR